MSKSKRKVYRLIRQIREKIIDEYARSGIKRRERFGKIRWNSKLRFEKPHIYSRETREVYYIIDVEKLPRNVSIARLYNRNTLMAIEHRINRSIRFVQLPNNKIALCVKLVEKKQFPRIVKYNDIVIPENAPPLTVPLGVDNLLKPTYINLRRLVHLLVAGATDSGKSTFIHAIIRALVTRNDSAALKLVLIDLKGSELTMYNALPHTDNCITDAISAVKRLDELRLEIDERNTIFNDAGVRNIEEYNQKSDKPMPYTVCIIDEIAILFTNKTKYPGMNIQVGTVAENKVSEIAALARSSGIVLIIATQQVRKDIISRTIIANFENRVCLKTSDKYESWLVIGSFNAGMGIPSGRLFIKNGSTVTEYQGVYTSTDDITALVNSLSIYD